MTHTPDEFDYLIDGHAPQQVQADRALSPADRDAMWTAAQHRRRHRSSTLREGVLSAVGALVLAAMVAIITQGWWRTWLGWG